MSEDNDDSTTFFRQRRDLFVISAVLLLIPIADIKIASNISIQQFGMSMQIGKPMVITDGLWVLWGYWYLRYFQAYSALNKNHLKVAYHSELSLNLFSKFVDKAEKFRDQLIAENKFGDGSDIGYEFKKQEYYAFKSEYTCDFTQYAPTTSEVNKITEVISVKGFKYNFYQFKALIKCILKRIDITEYLLPFVFGLAPLVYFVITRVC